MFSNHLVHKSLVVSYKHRGHMYIHYNHHHLRAHFIYPITQFLAIFRSSPRHPSHLFPIFQANKCWHHDNLVLSAEGVTVVSIGIQCNECAFRLRRSVRISCRTSTIDRSKGEIGGLNRFARLAPFGCKLYNKRDRIISIGGATGGIDFLISRYIGHMFDDIDCFICI